FLDCFTTQQYMQSVEMERNRMARRWMKKYGKEKVIGSGFVLAIIITVVAYADVVWITPQWYSRLLYLLSALVVSVAQFFVALVNDQQKHNWLRRIIVRFWELFVTKMEGNKLEYFLVIRKYIFILSFQ